MWPKISYEVSFCIFIVDSVYILQLNLYCLVSRHIIISFYYERRNNLKTTVHSPRPKQIAHIRKTLKNQSNRAVNRLARTPKRTSLRISKPKKRSVEWNAVSWKGALGWAVRWAANHRPEFLNAPASGRA